MPTHTHTHTHTDSQLKPVASSSPNNPQIRRTSKLPRFSPLTRSTPSRQSPLTKATPPSPIPSAETSPVSLPEDLVRYQSYIPPQKLQIVKPMEGSVTLLKWKLLATPQLGGTKTYFSNASTAGVHLKRWPASGIRDSSMNDLPPEEPYDTRMAVSAMDLRELNATYPPARPAGHVRRHKATPTKSKPLPREQPERSEERGQRSSQSRSLLSQFGSFLGSGLSRLKFSRGETAEQETTPPQPESTDAGLGGLL